MLMVSNTPLGKKAVFSLPRNNLHDTCQDITFPPGHTLIDYPGAQNKDSNTKCLLQKKKKRHNAITNMIALVIINTWGLACSLNQ